MLIEKASEGGKTEKIIKRRLNLFKYPILPSIRYSNIETLPNPNHTHSPVAVRGGRNFH